MGEDALGNELQQGEQAKTSVYKPRPLHELPPDVRDWIQAENVAARRTAHLESVRAKIAEITGSPQQKEREIRRDLRRQLREAAPGSADARRILAEIRQLFGVPEEPEPQREQRRRGLRWPGRSGLPQVPKQNP